MSIKSSQTLIKEALSEVKTITPKEALEMVNSNQCNLIDIRDGLELEREGRVENSHHVSRGFKESYSFEESLDLEMGRLERDKTLTPMVMYKEMGMYYKMVKAYKDSFKNVHVIFYEDFRDNVKLEMDKVYNFLGISRDVEIDLNIKYNVGGKRWKSQKLKYLIKDSNYLTSLMKFILPRLIRSEIYNFLVKILSRKVKPINEVTKKPLNDYFKEDVTQLSRLLDKDLKHWMN